ncbi:hypothetical protein HD597_001864 [Nonomuraea thailandensis]|uniref:Uncharacterized protein n=1 Tax=Nonomuraea thailandensis TaxID=1188745 RepID=A0A9X2GCH0_9ACTN|nr:hypothetical protein [Nonomuraea thailandensis]MCP2354844.1 hypothetical protein [Nonomuraea thailandensis]
MPPTIRIAALAAAASVALVPLAAPAASAGATAKPGLRACYDGTCRLTLTKGVSFRVSSRFGITRLAITFTSTTVRVKGTGTGVMSQAFLGEGSTGSVNDIGVRVVSLSPGKAVLRLTARR